MTTRIALFNIYNKKEVKIARVFVYSSPSKKKKAKILEHSEDFNEILFSMLGNKSDKCKYAGYINRRKESKVLSSITDNNELIGIVLPWKLCVGSSSSSSNAEDDQNGDSEDSEDDDFVVADDDDVDDDNSSTSSCSGGGGDEKEMSDSF